MRPLIAALLLLLALPVRADFTLGLTAPAWAGFDEGVAGYDRGDYATALREWRPLAEQGHAEAQFKLANMYFNGQGVPLDIAEALEWLWKAADQGHAEAQDVSGLLLGGLNSAEAAKWYRKAAEQGDADAQYNLGFLYASGGRGLAQDYAEAAKWYRLAADQGHPKGQYYLGMMYFNGQGLPQDFSEAVKWLILAAEQGDAGAQVNLGAMYANGQEVPQDFIQAFTWFDIAAAKESERGAAYRDFAAKELNPSQITKAQAMAQEWMAAFEKRKKKQRRLADFDPPK